MVRTMMTNRRRRTAFEAGKKPHRGSRRRLFFSAGSHIFVVMPDATISLSKRFRKLRERAGLSEQEAVSSWGCRFGILRHLMTS
jgi:hypothetical protein